MTPFNREELEQLYREQETYLEQFYPGQVVELATLTGESEAMVEAKIDYMARTTSISKYQIIETVLTYHRIHL